MKKIVIASLFDLKCQLDKVPDDVLKSMSVGVDVEGSGHLTCGMLRYEDDDDLYKKQKEDARTLRKYPATKKIIEFFQACGEAESDEDNDGYQIEV